MLLKCRGRVSGIVDRGGALGPSHNGKVGGGVKATVGPGHTVDAAESVGEMGGIGTGVERNAGGGARVDCGLKVATKGLSALLFHCYLLSGRLTRPCGTTVQFHFHSSTRR